MTVKEYRDKHRNCKYCKYCKLGFCTNYCYAREKEIHFNKAKMCPVYEAKEFYGKGEGL